jgi:transcriptional regulator with XRE-family HTH domain
MRQKYLNKIKATLDKSGQSQLWLSEQIGVSKNTISSFCRNDTQPKIDILYKIADVLNIDIFKLLVPNKYSRQIMKTLYLPTSKSEAQKLNEVLHAMFKNSHSTNINFSYSKYSTPSILGQDMFNYLVEILEQDDLVEYSPHGIKFTLRGYTLVEDFEDKEIISKKHIGYEKIWYQSLSYLN